MRRRIRSKYWWAIFSFGALSFVVPIEFTGKLFFINRTQSMPTGMYIKRGKLDVAIGDIIGFNQSKNKTNLIKYVAAVWPAKFCIDEQKTFWVDDIPVAQLNIEKYPSKIREESHCRRLESDEILALGDHPDSYDSRYFGPVKIKDVITRVELIWQFK